MQPSSSSFISCAASSIANAILSLIPPSPTIDRTIKVLLWGSKRSGKTAILYRWKLETFIPTVPTVGLLEESFIHSSALTRGVQRLSRVNVAEVGRDPVSLEVQSCRIPVEVTTQKDDDDDWKRIDLVSKGKYSSYRARRKAMRACCKCLRRYCLSCLRYRRTPRVLDYAVQVWTRIINSTNAVVYVVDSSSRASLMEMFEDVNFILSNDSIRMRTTRIAIIANKQDVTGAIDPGEVERMLDLPPQVRTRVRVFGASALTGQNVEEALVWLEESVAPNALQMKNL